MSMTPAFGDAALGEASRKQMCHDTRFWRCDGKQRTLPIQAASAAERRRGPQSAAYHPPGQEPGGALCRPMPPPVDSKPSGVDCNGAQHSAMPNEAAPRHTIWHPIRLVPPEGTPYRTRGSTPRVPARRNQMTKPEQPRDRGVVEAPSRGPTKADGPQDGALQLAGHTTPEKGAGYRLGGNRVQPRGTA